MFNLSGSELIFLVLIALVVLGPDKLPEAMRKAGKLYNDFKKMTAGFQDEMRTVLDEPLRELRETADLVKNAAMYDPSLLAPPGTPTIGETTFLVGQAPAPKVDAAPATPVAAEAISTDAPAETADATAAADATGSVDTADPATTAAVVNEHSVIADAKVETAHPTALIDEAVPPA